ncbi:hypothetical protein NFI96_032635, partial [Prochilodus magdalenae]
TRWGSRQRMIQRLLEQVKTDCGQLEYLNSKYKDPEVEELISLATVLDPRFHTQYTGSEEIQIMKARAVQEMVSFLSEQSSASALHLY